MKLIINGEKQQAYLEYKNIFEHIKARISVGSYFSSAFKPVSQTKNKVWRYVKAAIAYAEEISGRPCRYSMMNKLDVVDNRIVFGTFQNSYTCNCKYIAEEIARQNLDFEMFFIVTPDIYEHHENLNLPKNVYLVKRGTAASFYVLATSKFWIDNALNCVWKKIPKKPNQIYMNTWHGSLGIKKLGGSWHWRRIASKANEKIDYFITDSTFDEDVFSNSFWPDAKWLKVGHPRNDMFYDKEYMAVCRKKVCEYYDIDETDKLFMYAPTFRDTKSDLSAINMDYELVEKALEERFGGNWKIISRLHYHNANNEETQKMFADNKNVIDASLYPDMQELMAAADAGATDYSSWIFDYMFTGRPAFIYAEDIEKYVDDRGFYYSLKETPFIITKSSEELCEKLLTFKEDEYARLMDIFLKERGYYGEGKACKGVVDFMLKNIS